ncbi:transposase [Paenibacillus sp. IHB B 3084]|uniref:RNA-guided endonuclease InsQ/TnpB family protein n=1 Tax=Paenibacillus sp. IHB B 3084 TaxID=867076 RepID=UPI0007223FE9|nr:RNA-guided endonuclease TnpB family protein [Paenibacillus sp. IHB B 3084]ALP39030.1 transposase [Paenibacillus sp. IHB B 3084]
MVQTITMSIRIYPEYINLLEQQSEEYVKTVNSIVDHAIEVGAFPTWTTKNVKANLPSAVCNQAIRDAKSVFSKFKKQKIRSVLKKPVYYVNNQNYKIGDESLSFPVMKEGKSKRIICKAFISSRDQSLLQDVKMGMMRIIQKSNKWFAQISITKITPTNHGEKIIGIDLGLKVPAVAVTDDNKTRFFGNGRENKYMKRKFRSKRKELGKKKKLNAIRNLNHKEQRWMKDKDHKVSRQIINFAVKNEVSTIRLEKLTNIRNSTRTSRKNEKNLHTWSFYRLAQCIEYKANLTGIKVEYVNPKYTSQTCPVCKKLNKAKDRLYACICGFHSHRDRVGAINIIHAPVVDGKSLSA